MDKQSFGPRIDQQADRLPFNCHIYGKKRYLGFKADLPFPGRDGSKHAIFLLG